MADNAKKKDDGPKPDAPQLATRTPTAGELDDAARDEARKRAEQCGREVAALCAKHRCRIVAYLGAPEPVGTDGAAAILRAGYAFYPE